jgi:TPR repeat protein
MEIPKTILDPNTPWKLPRQKWTLKPYPYTKTATEWKNLFTRASDGVAEAEYVVAIFYNYGCKDRRGRILVHRSSAKAQLWLRRSAKHGFGPAQCHLGVKLSGKDASANSRREAVRWFKKAYHSGEGYAAIDIAITYREDGRMRDAVAWLKKGANKKDSSAILQLGIHNYWGIGARSNYVEAIRGFRKAIRNKYISGAERDDAFFYLAVAYFEGKGVKPSLAMTLKYLERANLEKDHPAAARLLKYLTKTFTEPKV